MRLSFYDYVYLCLHVCVRSRLSFVYFFLQAEDGIRYLVRSRGLGDVYKRQNLFHKLLKYNGSPKRPESGRSGGGGIDPDRDRPVIHKVQLHVGAESAGLDTNTLLGTDPCGQLDQAIEEPASHLGRGSRGE